MAGDVPAHVIAWAAAAGAVTQCIGPSFRWLSRARLAKKKLSLEELQADQARLDSGYTRLEKENIRLSREVADLRTALNLERGEHEKTAQELERIRERCENCERYMRMLGKKLE